MKENMHNNYVGHPYARTLRFFEAYSHCPYAYSSENFAELMLSMDKLTTIDELFEMKLLITNKHFKTNIIIQNLPYEICAALAGRYGYLFRQDYRAIEELRHNMLQDVYDCFNTNVFRLFKESKEPTIVSCGECIVNLTELSEKYDEQIKEIVQYAKDMYHIDDEELSNEIRSRKESLYKNLRKIKDFKKNTNDYQSTKHKIQDDLDFVLKYKLRMSGYDQELLNEILSSGKSPIKDILYNEDLRISVIGLVALVGFIAILPAPIFKLIVIVISGVIILLALALSSVR
jgi:hypothetical protein